MVMGGEPAFWTRSADDICGTLRCGKEGLSASEAKQRFGLYGPNADAAHKPVSVFKAISRRLLEPLSLILLAAAVVSAGTGDIVGGSIIATILILSIGLDTLQEGHALRAADILRQSVALTAEVRRDGAYVQIPVDGVVPGDLIRVRAGDIIPADGLVIDSTAFTANEAALTGEPYRARCFAALSHRRAKRPLWSSIPGDRLSSARRRRRWATPRRNLRSKAICMPMACSLPA
jgi:Mg2+-importing ATPase